MSPAPPGDAVALDAAALAVAGEHATARADAGLSAGALAFLLLGFSLSVIDFFIVNVALPTMGRDLHATNAQLELVVSGYGLSYALLLVFGGRLGDAHGRRRLFIGGIAAFTVTSLACGVAPSVATLIVARVAQGAAAAMMVPQVLATMHASLSGPRRARAVGAYGAAAGLSMVAGQALGGVIVSADVAGSGWRGIFLVNVPIGLLALLALSRALPETRSERPASIDRGGTLLLALTLLCLLVPLTEGRSLGWPWWSWVMLAVVPLAAVALVRQELALERAGRMPLVPPSILRVRGVRRGLAMAIPFFASFGGFMFVYAIVSQDDFHISPLVAGLALVPYAFAFFVASLINARLVRRLGRRVVSLGAGVQGLACVGIATTLAVHPAAPVRPVFELLFLMMGLGQGLVISPMFRIVLAEVPGDLAGAGAGVLTTVQQSSLALGVALLGALDAGLTAPLGFAGAAALTVGVSATIGIGVALAARSLPQLR